MNLSTHFTLEELVASDIAIRRGIDNTVPADILTNLRRLAETLEMIRHDALEDQPMRITSGYRSEELNWAVGGSADSAHCRGLAADFVCPSLGSPIAVCRAIVRAQINLDQLIHEFGHWCHVGLAASGYPARNQRLTSVSPVVGVIRYELGIRAV